MQTNTGRLIINLPAGRSPGPERLAEVTLAEVPAQVMGFFESKAIRPNPPKMHAPVLTVVRPSLSTEKRQGRERGERER